MPTDPCTVRRRAARKAAGVCVDCPRRRKRGVGKTGWPYSRCGACITRQARMQARWQANRRRAGRCVSCPATKPRGDRHYECPRCRRARVKRLRASRRLQAAA